MKARLLAVLLVSTLVLASAAPIALSQESAEEGGDGGNVTIVDCSQVQNLIVGQYADADARDREVVAAVAQELNVSQEQVNACLGNPDGDGPEGEGEEPTKEPEAEGEKPTEKPEAEGEETGSVAGDESDVIAGTIPEAEELPETGGPSLLAVGAGLALVAGGALIRFRR